jgi:hypothetical protein
MKLHFAFPLFIIAQVAAAQTADPVSTYRRQQYDAIYEYYVDVCGATEFQPVGKPNGGSYGHGMMYIKGACYDQARPDFPHLHLCGSEDGPNAGAGVSLDYFFKNVAWTAVDGRDFTFYGDLPTNQPLNEVAREKIIQKTIDKGYFSGVQFQDFAEKQIKPDESRPHFIGRELFGTEFGLALSRSAYCTRLPIAGGVGRPKNSILIDLIKYLNDFNEKVHSSQDGLKYDTASFNCATLMHNALAAIGFWPKKQSSWSSERVIDKVIHLNDLVIPLNTMYDAIRRANDPDLAVSSPQRIVGNTRTSYPLNKYGWLPAQAGVIADILKIHEYQNQLFLTDSRPKLFDLFDELLMDVNLPSGEIRTREFENYLKWQPTVDLGENLKLWRDRYRPASSATSGTHDPRFDLYKKYLYEQSDAVNRGLSKLANHPASIPSIGEIYDTPSRE